MDAARSLLIRSSYQELSLDAVARKAGIAKGTLYLYYKDKYDLLMSVFEDMLAAVDARVNQVAPPDGTLASFRSLVREGLSFVDETHYFLSPFSPGQNILHGSMADRAFCRKHLERHIEVIVARIKAGIASGLLRRVDPVRGALMFMELTRTFLTYKVINGSQRPLREQADEFLDLFLRGVGKEGKK
ncbi:MAG: TetR/AcrR family transcriptional regulator [Elusimicrobiota bacterium]|jgi:TetR/AcrR family fatty acid metabolism transcriptional regulator